MAKDKQNNIFIILIASAAILLSIFIIFYGKEVPGSTNNTTQSVQNEYPPMQDSNSVEAIEDDLEATELDDIDKELNEIEAELETAY